MSINVGTQLGSYQILAILGEGGMGRVFRARDLKLKRDVAIKVLPEEFSQDAERVARFHREAEALAALNHARIGAIYDVTETDGAPFLVLELVEGETLAERVARGPIALRDSLEIAKQISEALEAAHEKGVVHRDLKPANIKITPEGQVKVLDFGLAKIREPNGVVGNLSHSPTLVSGTIPGLILGTAAYMSPEQAKGKEADRRSDIWSFGAVLFEVLAGRPPFDGETITEILGGILKVDPDWRLLPAHTPAGVRKLIGRCLERDRMKRLQHIGEARIAIDEALQHPESKEGAIVRPVRRSRLAWAVAGSFAIAFSIALALLLRVFSTAPEMRLDILTPATLDPFSLAISPDGRKVAFVATSEGRSRLWLRSLDSVSAEPLAGAEDASSPFWSPDSRSVGFFAEGKLQTLNIASGAVQVVTTASSSRGGTWGPDGSILFAVNIILRVPASGGQPVPVTDGRLAQGTHGFPYFLPDGHHFLFTVRHGGRMHQVYVASIDGGEPRHLLDTDSATVLVSSGHLLFTRQATLFAQKFDLKSLKVSGDAVPIAKDLLSNAGNGISALSASSNALIVYRTGRIPDGANMQYVWFDRSGKKVGLVGEANMGANPVLSPDGRRLAMQSARAEGNSDIWLFDLMRNLLIRFTFDPAGEYNPIWSPDGLRIIFGSTRSNALGLYVKSATGLGNEDVLLGAEKGLIAQDWSRDGRFVLYLTRVENNSVDTGADIWALPMTGDRKPFPVATTKFVERDAQFSPDGNWVAYASNESGPSQIYVQPFPNPSGKWQVSVNGGFQPRWRPDGKELFYLDSDGGLIAVPIRAAQNGQLLEPGTPVPLFRTTVAGGPEQSILNRQQYVVSPDGARFLIRTGTQESVTLPITVMLNWKGVQ